MNPTHPTIGAAPAASVTHSPLMALWTADAWAVLSQFATTGGTDVA